MDTTQTPSVASTSRFVFWWLLAHLAETAIRIRSTVIGSPGAPQVDRTAGVNPSDGVTPPIEAPNHHAGSPVATGHLSLKPLALAGLAAYVMGIAVVLVIRSQFV